MRRSEIVLVMVIDMTAKYKFPDMYGAVGFGLVLFSVTGMAFSNDIQKAINSRLARRKRPAETEEI